MKSFAQSKRMKTYHSCPDHLLSIKTLSSDYVNLIMEKAEDMKTLVAVNGGDDRLKHRVLANVFYEPSTRTSCSFQTAMLRLGGSVVSLNETHSSVKKGESLEDTIQTLASYCDVIVLRHPVKGSALAASLVSLKPIINAGDGIGEHPTQALLDLFTIKSELGRIGGNDGSNDDDDDDDDGNDGGSNSNSNNNRNNSYNNNSNNNENEMVVVLLGDLKNGRTVHSLVYLLSRYNGIRLIYCAPPELALPLEIFEELKALGLHQEMKSLDEAIVLADVLYVTRVQKERFASEEEYNAVKGSYCVNNDIMRKAKSKMVVMHPLPRLDEISPEVDSDSRAAYFRQMENGMYVRMAILDLFLHN